jgi:hypothetical protein
MKLARANNNQPCESRKGFILFRHLAINARSMTVGTDNSHDYQPMPIAERIHAVQKRLEAGLLVLMYFAESSVHSRTCTHVTDVSVVAS